jgi:uncharacterized membrane protein YjjP (DUF1212 family)
LNPHSDAVPAVVIFVIGFVVGLFTGLITAETRIVAAIEKTGSVAINATTRIKGTIEKLSWPKES